MSTVRQLNAVLREITGWPLGPDPDVLVEVYEDPEHCGWNIYAPQGGHEPWGVVWLLYFRRPDSSYRQGMSPGKSDYYPPPAYVWEKYQRAKHALLVLA